MHNNYLNDIPKPFRGSQNNNIPNKNSNPSQKDNFTRTNTSNTNILLLLFFLILGDN